MVFLRVLLLLILSSIVATTTAQTATGFRCQKDADCLNEGLCQTGLCSCPPGTGGDDCSASCPRACQNGGSCRFHEDVSHGSDQDGDSYCECRPGFLGVSCEIPFVECGALKCLHGGTCGEDGSSCHCPSPRVGDQCQYDSPQDPRIPPFECQSDPDCLNGGKCVNLQGEDNYCQCPFGYGGEDCASRCDRQCQNNGSCRFHGDISHASDQDGNAYCECPPHRFMGVSCEIPFVPCPGPQELKCLWGGACERVTNGYRCDCPWTRTGTVCEYASGQEQVATTDSSSSSSTVTNKGSQELEFELAVILLVAVVVGAGLITGVAMVVWKRTTPVDTEIERDITSSTVPHLSGPLDNQVC